MERKFKHKKNGSTMVYKDGCMKIDNLVIEGHPNMEYWEELNPIGYKVLSYTKNGNLYDEELEGSDRVVHVGSVLEVDKIIKVKRLSDNETFKIGDTVKSDYLDKEGYEIKEFVEDISWQGGLRVVRSNNKGVALSIIHKTEKPLFTTEDGIDIYENDSYYVPQSCNGGIQEFSGDKNKNYKLDNSKRFSTLYKAKEYIIMSQTVLSLNDVFKVYPEFKKREPGVRTHHAQELIDLVLRDEK